MRLLLVSALAMSMACAATHAHAFFKSVQKQYGGTHSSDHKMDAGQERQVQRMLRERAMARAAERARKEDDSLRAAQQKKRETMDAVGKFMCIQTGKC